MLSILFEKFKKKKQTDETAQFLKACVDKHLVNLKHDYKLFPLMNNLVVEFITLTENKIRAGKPLTHGQIADYIHCKAFIFDYKDLFNKESKTFIHRWELFVWLVLKEISGDNYTMYLDSYYEKRENGEPVSIDELRRIKEDTKNIKNIKELFNIS